MFQTLRLPWRRPPKPSLILTHACQQLSNNVQKCNACRMGEKASDVLHLSRKAAFQTAK